MLLLFMLGNYNSKLFNDALHKSFLIYVVDILLLNIMLLLKPVKELKPVVENCIVLS